ncbi:hypothetical protein IZ6_21730 [Terrihabitans soli]|uniref:Uncharacterized protein n=1 Tax=Terrihabitans soli TaxID=708113 RepID=A0A6S6QXZ5_9HYPH|nr:hypothetical protein [Terrihabitans soli]BCJ91438.1 hypothetical protein IZ6_21730 [Terrihabitans soli]
MGIRACLSAVLFLILVTPGRANDVPLHLHKSIISQTQDKCVRRTSDVLRRIGGENIQDLAQGHSDFVYGEVPRHGTVMVYCVPAQGGVQFVVVSASTVGAAARTLTKSVASDVVGSQIANLGNPFEGAGFVPMNARKAAINQTQSQCARRAAAVLRDKGAQDLQTNPDFIFGVLPGQATVAMYCIPMDPGQTQLFAIVGSKDGNVATEVRRDIQRSMGVAQVD